MERWQIGNVSITRVVDVMQNIDLAFLIPEATPENLQLFAKWLQPHFLNADTTVPLSIHTFVIESDDTTIVVDTCIGNDKPRAMPEWNQRQSNFLSDLTTAGAARETVDFVLCTHLHVDHVGWNTMLIEDAWVPTFPNAKYLIGREEWHFWENEEDPFGAEAKSDSIVPIIESDLVELIETNHVITEQVRVVPTPGHTPGHISVLIESDNERAVITGDLFHHPVQFAKPCWKDIADVQSDVAEKTRHDFIRTYGDETLILGTHFAPPTAGNIMQTDGEHWFKALD